MWDGGIGMFNRVDRVKERRRARMERIRMQVRDSMPPFMHDLVDPVEGRYTPSAFPFSRESEEEQFPAMPPQEKVGIQVFLSLILVGAFWLMFQTGVSVPASWREAVREVMTREFNFAGVSAWYEEKLGQMPTVLPVLTANKAVPAQGKATDRPWQVVDAWKVVKPFDPTSTKMILDVGANGQIQSGEAGWVTFVGEQPEYGLTVVVRLPGNREAWYGNLAAVAVEKDDMVKQGDILGVAGSSPEAKRTLYLGMKENQQFIDPLEVIPLD